MTYAAADNFAQYWEGWAQVTIPREHFFIKAPVLELPKYQQRLRFGKRIEMARSLIHQKRDNDGGARMLASALPEDLVVTLVGPLAERRKAGGQYGCDVTKLPVPPARTLEPYKFPAQPDKNNAK